ncbi:MAG TPA: hypothetical protein VIK94_04155 [Bacilli bacterium]
MIIVIRIKDVAQIAILAVIIFGIEAALMFLPNVQVTVLLIVVYSKVFNLKKSILIVTIYTILDNLLFLNIYYLPFMLVGWLVIPVSLNTVFKKVNNVYILATLSIFYVLFYSLMYVVADVIILKIGFLERMLSDSIFVMIFIVSSFVSILWLYEPLKKLILKLEEKL